MAPMTTFRNLLNLRNWKSKSTARSNTGVIVACCRYCAARAAKHLSITTSLAAAHKSERSSRSSKKIARSNASILITGETGTGKELIASLAHYNSLRAKQSFVKVNCAALQENLLESELFGHEKGAFTSADRQRIGCFEQATGARSFSMKSET